MIGSHGLSTFTQLTSVAGNFHDIVKSRKLMRKAQYSLLFASFLLRLRKALCTHYKLLIWNYVQSNLVQSKRKSDVSGFFLKANVFGKYKKFTNNRLFTKAKFDCIRSSTLNMAIINNNWKFTVLSGCSLNILLFWLFLFFSSGVKW